MNKETQTTEVVTKKDLTKAAVRYMFMACNAYNYENHQGPAVVFGLEKVLRKIHMEEKDGIEALDTVQNFKTGMMGPLAGIGDTLIWVLYPTIMGSIAAYMGLEGNPTGALIWMLLNVIFFFFRIKLFHLGYDSGLKLITTLGDKLSVFTEAASIMGLTVIGALIPSVVKMSVGLVFKSGKVKLAIQTGVLDKIMPALLPVALTFIVYKLLASKKLTVIQVIFLIIILALVCSFFGILAL